MRVDRLVARGWGVVADAFAQTLATDGGAGAALCVYADGAPVVDVWGGTAAPGSDRPWAHDTVACVFSATKGVAAVCAHLLVQRGLLDLDAPVARYWPELAAGDKQDLKVRWVLSHQAGLLLLDADLTLDDVVAVDPVLRALEAQRPLWEPGTAVGYHAMTYGYLVGELVRRVTGRTLGTFFAEEVVAPLGLNAWIGLPPDLAVDLATLERAPGPPNPLEALAAADPDGPVARVLKVVTLGGAFPASLLDERGGDFNDRRVLAVELPAAGMVTDARSLARVYAATVSEVDGVRLLAPATSAACVPLQTTQVPIFGAPADGPRTLDFGLGFLARPYLSASSFGHPGASGSTGFADLDARLGFGYVPRLMRPEDADPRVGLLVDAVRAALG